MKSYGISKVSSIHPVGTMTMELHDSSSKSVFQSGPKWCHVRTIIAIYRATSTAKNIKLHQYKDVCYFKFINNKCLSLESSQGFPARVKKKKKIIHV